ncbi:hypothetical protein KC973_00965 [Candidatus Saccharibacteria bacterium]|nr:hypothetical protein [Candidatus Saccharibacteria bacterium]
MDCGDIINIPPEPVGERRYQMDVPEVANHYFLGKANFVSRLLRSAMILEGDRLPDYAVTALDNLEDDLNRECIYMEHPIVARSNYHLCRMLDDDGAPTQRTTRQTGTIYAIMEKFMIASYDVDDIRLPVGLVVCSLAEIAANNWVQFQTPLCVGHVKPLLPALN